MMLLAELDIMLVVPLAVFGAVAAAAWFVFDMMSSKKSRSEERLEELHRGPSERGQRTSAADTMAKMLEKATPTLAKPLSAQNEKDANKLRDRLSHAGFRNENAPMMFNALKVACGLAGLLLAGGPLLLTYGFDINVLSKIFIVAGGLFYLPEIGLALMASKRKKKIFLGLPDALDLLVVCVEAGLGLDQAMRKVAEEMIKSHKLIAYEFGVCNMQLQMGRSRSEVLHELGQRSGVDDLNALASIIIQADKFGSSIAQALRVQSDSMRTRRRQLAEEKAAKTAVKLIFPLVLFIFPGIFVILVGPAAITMINEMLPAMQR